MPVSFICVSFYHTSNMHLPREAMTCVIIQLIQHYGPFMDCGMGEEYITKIIRNLSHKVFSLPQAYSWGNFWTELVRQLHTR